MNTEQKKMLEEFDSADNETCLAIRLAIAQAACIMLAADRKLTPADAIGDACQVFAAVFLKKDVPHRE